MEATGSFYATVLLVSVMGTIAGWLYKHNPFDMFWGLLGGFITGTFIWFKLQVKYQHPELFFDVSTETSSSISSNSPERVILSLTIIANGTSETLLFHGLTKEEWYQLGDGVISRGYKYTLRDLQDIFGATNGNRIYGRITQKLGDKSTCVLVPAGSNGWAVTDNIGKQFFDALHARDLIALDVLPRSED